MNEADKRMTECFRTGRWSELIEWAKVNLSHNQSTKFESWLMIGIAYKNLKDYRAALQAILRALEIEPNHGEAHYVAGLLWYYCQQPVQAERHLQEAIRLGCWRMEVWGTLGRICFLQKRLKEAEENFRQGLLLWPQEPSYSFNLAQVLLLKGDWTEGLTRWEARLLHSVYEQQNAFYQPIIAHLSRWKGETFSGKHLLIHQDMGFGDTIQFARYLSLVSKRGGKVTVAVKKPLLRVLKFQHWPVEVIEEDADTLQEHNFDLYIPAISLPLVFGTTPCTIFSSSQYISGSHQWKQKMSSYITQEDTFKVGVVWSSNDKAPIRSPRGRSIKLELLDPLLSLNGISWYSLQIGSAQEELLISQYGERIRDVSLFIEDFADTAGVIEQLDLVITVDTAVAHLAGAMGKTVWVLLPYLPDWRWLLEGASTPWYESMRLFRCVKPGEWESVIKQVKSALIDYLAAEYRL